MAKSSKKGAKANVEPVAAARKPLKKGKREVEEALEKELNLKKQKKDAGAESIEKKKIPVKALPPSNDTSSDSDSEEEMKVNVPVKKAAPPVKIPAKDSSSDEDSSSDDDTPAPAKKPVAQAAKNGKLSSSSDESDSDDEAPKTKPAGLTTKKKEESSSEESEEESSDSDEDQSAKKKVPTVTAENGAKVVKKSDSESDSDDDGPAKPTTKKGSAVTEKKKDDSSSEDTSSSGEDQAVAKKVPATTAKKLSTKEESSDDSDSDEESDDGDAAPNQSLLSKRPSSAIETKQKKENATDSTEDDSSEESDDEPQKKKIKAVVASKSAPAVAKESSEDESSEESSDDEPPKGKAVKTTAPASKQSSSDDSSEDESSEEGDQPIKNTPKKNVTDVEMVDAVPTKDLSSQNMDPKTPATPFPQSSTTKTIFLGNVSYNAEQADVEAFFKDCGEVLNVRFATDSDGNFKGFAHVDFATHEAAAKAIAEFHGKELLGRAVRVDSAKERVAYAPRSGNDGNSYRKGPGSEEVLTIYVRGFDKNADAFEIKDALREHFSSCGEITRIFVPRGDDGLKGFAYLDFTGKDSLHKAYDLDQSELNGFSISVEEAKPRLDYNAGGGRGGGRSGGRGDSGGRSGGRRGGGRGGRFGGGGGGRFGGGRGRGNPRPSLTSISTGKKTTFGDD